jgi:hypothetical protein
MARMPWISGEASSRVIAELINGRTLGPQLNLAKKFGMPLPVKIMEDLVQRRNKVATMAPL